MVFADKQYSKKNNANDGDGDGEYTTSARTPPRLTERGGDEEVERGGDGKGKRPQPLPRHARSLL